jgi:hypothetical protein
MVAFLRLEFSISIILIIRQAVLFLFFIIEYFSEMSSIFDQCKLFSDCYRTILITLSFLLILH